MSLAGYLSGDIGMRPCLCNRKINKNKRLSEFVGDIRVIVLLGFQALKSKRICRQGNISTKTRASLRRQFSSESVGFPGRFRAAIPAGAAR
ncbi:hypothetical protein [Paracoccus halophilus]|uniref:hypothetical protein n=1 Tax=Paracoccus halophilus TaxID=376733 RepID=UPI001113F59B|nr:hypothetical protein [Paracoccus halophilus]